MSLVSKDDEKEWSSLVSRLTAGKDFWTSKKEESDVILPKLGFQHFAVQLRDEDLQKEGTLHRGFLIRDRTEDSKAASGFSEFKNDDKEFQVILDVSQFKYEELEVKMIVDLYIIIAGVHKEKCEDDGECTREFTRRYLLPKGCASKTKECVYNNGILTITIEKRTDIVPSPLKVPISIGDEKDESKPLEVNGTSATTADTKKVPITNGDSEVETDPSKDSSIDEADPSKDSSIDEADPSKDSSADEADPSKDSSVEEVVPLTDEVESSRVSPADEVESSKVSPADEVMPLADVVDPSKVSPADEVDPSKVSPADEVMPLADVVDPSKVSPADEVVSHADVVVPTKVSSADVVVPTKKTQVKSKGSKGQKASS